MPPHDAAGPQPSPEPSAEPSPVQRPIGVFDSGAGGLSVVAAIRAALPQQAIRYFADTAYAPYGPRTDREIIERTQHCCRHLIGQRVSALVVACNTATANGVDALRAWAPVPVVGVEPGLKPAMAVTRNGRVGVLATPATLASARYRDLAARLALPESGVRFIERAAPGWVELVESGDLDSAHAHALVRAAMAPLLAADIDTLVLGCTHYPFLRAAIEAQAPGLTLVETGPAVARELQRRIAVAPSAADARDAVAAEPPPLMQFEASADTERFAALAVRLLAMVGAMAPQSGAGHRIDGALRT